MPAEAREVRSLSDGWSFRFGIADEAPVRPGFDDRGWAKVAVPHTWNRLGNPGTARDAPNNADPGMGWSNRTRVVEGQAGSVRVESGGRRPTQKKNNKTTN